MDFQVKISRKWAGGGPHMMSPIKLAEKRRSLPLTLPITRLGGVTIGLVVC